MSEGTSEVTEGGEASATKRKTLSLGERIKVVDYLRSQVEPIVADSNAAVAAMVSGATGVELNWQQLKYMIDDLEEMNLGSKVHVKSLLSTEDERMSALEARVAQLEESLETYTKASAGAAITLSDRISSLERKNV